MTFRPSDLSSRDCYSRSQARLNSQRYDSTGEGCPVLEESGTVCGETNSLGVFQEFRQMYDDCLKKLENSRDGIPILNKLTPFKKLIDDLWEQNAMLVETVEELEQEATCKVSNLQDRLNKSCQKISEYEEDIRSLTKIIQRFCENGMLDTTDLTFNTFCPEFVLSNCENSSFKTGFEKVTKEPDSVITNMFSYSDGIPLQSVCASAKKSKKREDNTYKTGRRSKVPFPKSLESEITRNIKPSNNYVDEFLKKSLHSKICSDSNCCCNGYDQITNATDGEERDYQECKGSININFNLGKDSVISDSDCCCSCSCKFDSNETD